MKIIAYTLLTVIVLSLSQLTPVNAGIYKCVAGDGSVTYSQTECPASNRTAKVLGKNGGSSPDVNCAIALPFIEQTIGDMRDGVSSFSLTKKYGGESHISRVTGAIVNYIYSFKDNETAVPSRIKDLTVKRCKAGNFGIPTCNALPAAFVNEQGGCQAIKPDSNNNSTFSSANAERDD